MKTFRRLNILDDAGSNRAMQQTLCDDSSLAIGSESLDRDLGTCMGQYMVQGPILDRVRVSLVVSPCLYVRKESLFRPGRKTFTSTHN